MIAHRPHTAEELCGIFAAAAERGARLELRGGGSMADVGSPRSAEIVDMRGFAGVVDYDPAELVLTVGAGTPLAGVQQLLAAKDQALAFDPFDGGPLFGGPSGAATIGGIVAAGTAGSRRLSGGGARDHLLGFTAISGRGETFVAGGRVVKNVTGFDLPKLMAGSWGRLAALTQITLRVLPRPRESITRTYAGLTLEGARALFAAAMASQASISAAAYRPGDGRDSSLTALRIEGFGPSVRARLLMLDGLGQGLDAMVGTDIDGDQFWNELATLSPLADGRPLWRISVPPSACSGLVAAMLPLDVHYLVDWAGARIWMTYNGPASVLRDAAAALGGHAMLIRGDPELRTATPAFHPQPASVAALEERVRRAFDPAGLFETGRF
ncbi:FAD-binding protein [Sphingomonas crusticola]|uniref:FAD-binding protein n=1 Tax=Sphingomonas crusticola TaxID=1697973 RepID=UPI000E21FAF6|nr:FAD-binding protein [Sphingomonas crusticola]